MRWPFIFTSLGVVRGKSKRGNRKCGPENYIWLQLVQWFQRRYLKTHTHILCTPEHNSWELFQMIKYGMGGGGLWRQSTIFLCGGGGDFFFQSSGQLAFVKMYNFLKVMVLHKNAVSSNGICWNEKKKKFLFLEEGSPEKKNELCECDDGGVDLIGGGSRKKLSPGEYTVLYSIKPGCFSKKKLKPRHIFGAVGTHRRLNPGT